MEANTAVSREQASANSQPVFFIVATGLLVADRVEHSDPCSFRLSKCQVDCSGIFVHKRDILRGNDYDYTDRGGDMKTRTPLLSGGNGEGRQRLRRRPSERRHHSTRQAVVDRVHVAGEVQASDRVGVLVVVLRAQKARVR
mgnify:FL=1|jgi:hypothetical protein